MVKVLRITHSHRYRAHTLHKYMRMWIIPLPVKNHASIIRFFFLLFCYLYVLKYNLALLNIFMSGKKSIAYFYIIISLLLYSQVYQPSKVDFWYIIRLFIHYLSSFFPQLCMCSTVGSTMVRWNDEGYHRQRTVALILHPHSTIDPNTDGVMMCW